MIGFINEHSFDQYGDWGIFLTFFLKAAQELAPSPAILFKDSGFFLQDTFKQRFNALAFPKDQRALIQELAFGNRYYRCWRPERVSDAADNYTCAAPVLHLNDVSICEAAERTLADPPNSVSLLTPSGSAFGVASPLNFVKVSSQQAIQLANAAGLEAVRKWLAAQRGHYDPTSSSAPRDFQTVLRKDDQRFRDTGKLERRFRRTIFEETETGRFYYVDDGHPGNSAHLEVFSASGEHLGTSDIATGTLNIASRVEGRRLKL